MKKLLTGTFLLLAASGFTASNKMSMVTYFPVPYVAYSQVNVDQQLDIGLTSTCEMSLGCNESDVNLKANRVNLNRGKLDLDGGKGVSGNTMMLGNVNSTDGQISFKNVRIQGGEMESLNAGSMKVKKLKLFDKEFPPCKGKGKDGNAEGKMQWQSLKLQGSTNTTGELYLVCGETDKSEAKCTADARTYWNETAQRCECPTGVYHNGACCSASTPKTDTRCWKASTTSSGGLVWSPPWIGNNTITQNIANQGTYSLTCSTSNIIGWAGGEETRVKCPDYSCSGSCEVSCNKPGINNPGVGGTGSLTPIPVPNPDPGVVTADGGPCTTEGAKCVAHVSISKNDSGCDIGNSGFKWLYCNIGYTYRTCIKSDETSTSYEQLWDSSDTKYSCGH